MRSGRVDHNDNLCCKESCGLGAGKDVILPMSRNALHLPKMALAWEDIGRNHCDLMNRDKRRLRPQQRDVSGHKPAMMLPARDEAAHVCPSPPRSSSPPAKPVAS